MGLYGEPRLIAGNANPELARSVAQKLGIPLVESIISHFADGEIRVDIGENVRGGDLFILQPTCPPVNDNLMELLITADALHRASAARITAVVPYFGYARQDRKASPRAPISARLVADMMTAAHINHVLTMDVHATQIQGFFDIPLDNLHAAPVLVEDIRSRYDLSDLIVVAPDVGGVVRARSLARRLGAPLAIIDKRRGDRNEVTAMNLIGSVEGKLCLLVDDMIDTAGTICKAAGVLVEEGGAVDVVAYATHGVFSGPAIQRIENSRFREVVVTDTLPTAQHRCGKLRVVSIADHLAEAVRRFSSDNSIAALYENTPAEKTGEQDEQTLDKAAGIL